MLEGESRQVKSRTGNVLYVPPARSRADKTHWSGRAPTPERHLEIYQVTRKKTGLSFAFGVVLRFFLPSDRAVFGGRSVNVQVLRSNDVGEIYSAVPAQNRLIRP